MANVANDIQYQQIPERRFRYADIVHKPMHVPVIARIMGQCVVLHCPTDIHHASHTKRYRLWYQKEYRRCSRVLAHQGNARAKRTLKERQSQKNKWAQTQREREKNRIPSIPHGVLDDMDELLDSNGDVVGNVGEEHNLD